MKCLKRTFIALVALSLMVVSASASIIRMKFTHNPAETLEMSINGMSLTISGISDTEKMADFMLIVYQVKRPYITMAQADDDGTVILPLPELPDGEYRFVVTYSAYGSAVARVLLPVTMKYKVSGRSAVLVDSPTYESNTAIADEADVSDEAMRFYAYCASGENVRNLAASITSGIESDYEKAFAVYSWVTANIYLDVDNVYSNVDTEQADDVLEKKEATSSGFAALTGELLRSLGIPVRDVRGVGVVNDVDNWLDDVSYNDTVSQYWNEAYIDGRWVIIDTAFGTLNTVTNGVRYRVAPVTKLYFDPDPRFFAYSHSTQEYETAPIYNGTKTIVVPALRNGVEKTAQSLGLPATVTADTTIGELSLPVSWDISAYDPDEIKSQTFEVIGTFTLPEIFETTTDIVKTVRLSVTVNARVLTDVKLTQQGSTTVFFEGDIANADGAVLSLYYDNGDIETVRDGFEVVCDTDEPGTAVLKIAYGSYSFEYDVTVLPSQPLGLVVASPMTKTEYYTGEPIDITGLELLLDYGDGYRFSADGTVDIKYDFSEPGVTTVVFECRGVRAEQTVTVRMPRATHAQVEVSDSFLLGQSQVSGNVVLVVFYENGEQKRFTDGYTVEYVSLPDGTVDITVSIEGVSAVFNAKEQKPEWEASVESSSADDVTPGTTQGWTTWEKISLVIAGVIALGAAAVFIEKKITYGRMRSYIRNNKK